MPSDVVKLEFERAGAEHAVKILSRDGAGDAGRLIVVSNRVADMRAANQTGGLAVALGQAMASTGGVWFGCSGRTSADAKQTPPSIERIGALVRATIDLTEDEEEGYYRGFANQCLWPALHYRLDLAECHRDEAEVYFGVNARMAECLEPLLEPGDVIWAHDYHQIPFGTMMREQGWKGRIGFFLHTPFPSPELFAAVPSHERLGHALLAYDLVGFQTRADLDNFERYAETFLNAERGPKGVLAFAGREIVAGTFPIGIDPEAFAQLAQHSNNVLDVAPGSENRMKTIVGVDRLDYTKGLPERLRGYDALLAGTRRHRGRVRFIQIAPPTRDSIGAYDDIRDSVEGLVGRINGRFGDLEWTPVTYLHRAVSHNRLAALFRQSAVGLVTPLRDGMNLVAKEYVAAQSPHNPGVLVLSRFAGAAEQMTDAILVNPHDSQDIARALDKALNMPLEERRARHRRLMQVIEDGNINRWRDDFLAQLCSITRNNSRPSRSGLGAA